MWLAVERRVEQSIGVGISIVHHDVSSSMGRRVISTFGHHLATEPGPGFRPLATYSDRRNTDDFGDLVECQTAKESELDDLRFSWIALSQVIERLVYRHDVRKRIGGCWLSVRYINEVDQCAVDTSWLSRDMSTRICRIMRADIAKNGTGSAS